MLQVGYQPVAANFFFYSAIIFLLILISETLGMLCSGAFRAELTGAIVLQALYVPLLMFVGFFQVCDGVSTCTCSCLLSEITYRPSAGPPSCLCAFQMQTAHSTTDSQTCLAAIKGLLVIGRQGVSQRQVNLTHGEETLHIRNDAAFSYRSI